MKVLVTLGTTRFDELLSAIDKLDIDKQVELTVQGLGIADYAFSSKFEFSSDIQTWYEWADVIVTHAGAGSIYNLLEQGKKIIVVPNTFRKDKHQLDIAKYVEENDYGLVCYDLFSIGSCIEEASKRLIKPYTKTEFSGARDISKVLFG